MNCLYSSNGIYTCRQIENFNTINNDAASRKVADDAPGVNCTCLPGSQTGTYSKLRCTTNSVVFGGLTYPTNNCSITTNNCMCYKK